MIDVSLAIPVGNGCAYAGVGSRTKLVFDTPDGERHFLMAIYGAFNAFGLIGSEKNGIVIFDDDSKQVLLDEHEIADSGYFGPTRDQMVEFSRLMKTSWDEFQDFVNNHPRARFSI